jgi:hypothetical protein
VRYKVGDKIRFVKPIRVNGEYGEVDKDIVFTISYVKYNEYWIGNMVFSPKILEEGTEPIAELNVTDILIERRKNGE